MEGLFGTRIENIERLCSSVKKTHYWLSFDGLKYIISMNPYKHLESEKTIIEKKIQFLVDNRQNLCEYGGLHIMIATKGKYVLGKVYNTMIFLNKNWESKSVLGFNSSK